MNVYFYSGFSKRQNSTKLPTTGVLYDCAIKEDCSLVTPRISLGGAFNPSAMNYCYIPNFSRYYFVTDWQWIGGAWVASLAVDALATYRTQIGGASVYILRADTTEYNGAVADGTYPATTEFTQIRTVASGNYWGLSPAEGTYIVGIISGAADSFGGITYYSMSTAQFSALKDFLFDEDFFQDVVGFPDVQQAEELLTSISPELLKTIYNPFQYIASVMWFPLQLIGGSYTIKVGWWTTEVSGSRIAQSNLKYSFQAKTIRIPFHPQAEDRGAYLNYAPFSEHVLHFPPFGSIPIDTGLFDFQTADSQYIYLNVTIDYVTGKASCVVSKSDGLRIAELHAQVGVPVQISQVTPSVEGMGQSIIVHGAGELVKGITEGAKSGGLLGALTKGIEGAGSGILNAISQPVAQVLSNGMNGSLAGITDTTATLTSKFYNIADADDTNRGRPVCEVATIGSYSGFVQCAEGDISIPGTQAERETVSSYLTSGFFYE